MDKYRDYVFLDIDGVLNNIETLSSDRCMTLDATRWADIQLSAKFSLWCKQHDILVIGTSSWFVGSDREDILKVSRFLDIEIVDIISHCGGGHGRGLSVLDFVEKHGLENWAVLDDAGGKMYTYPTVNVNGRIGITNFDLLNLKTMVDTRTPLWQTSSYRNRQEDALKQQRG